MYAVRKVHVKNYAHEGPEDRYQVQVERGGKPATDIQTDRISYVEEEEMYWRKANHIHKWFVDNVQRGVDTSQLTGTLGVANGGTGSTTLFGLLKGNGTSAIQTAVANTDYQRPITLTTTGTSGAATFDGTTLNVPQYAGTTYTATYPVTLTGSAFGLAFGTTTSNTWGGTQTFTNSPVLGSLTGIIKGSSGTLSAASNGTDYTLITANTCGAGNHFSGITAAGVLTCSADTGSGGSGVGTVATSSQETAGQVGVFGTTNGYPAKLYSAATSTPTIGSVLTYSGTLGTLIGGSSGTFGIANGAVSNTMLTNSTISGVALGSNLNSFTVGSDFTGTSYNGSAAVSDWALKMSQPHSWTGLQSFANASSSQLSVFQKAYFGGTATSTFDSTGALVLAGNLTTNITGSTQCLHVNSSGLVSGTAADCGSGGTSYFTLNGNDIYNNNNAGKGFVGIGTTTPPAKLSVAASSTDPTINLFGVYDSTGAPALTVATGTPHLQVNGTASTTGMSSIGNLYVGTTGTTTISSNGSVSIPSSANLVIPATATPSISSTNNLGINTTAASSSLRYYDGTNSNPLYRETTSSISIASTTALAANGPYVIGQTYVDIGNGTATTTAVACSTSPSWTTTTTSLLAGTYLAVEWGSSATTTQRDVQYLEHPFEISKVKCKTDSASTPTRLTFFMYGGATAD